MLGASHTNCKKIFIENRLHDKKLTISFVVSDRFKRKVGSDGSWNWSTREG